MGNLFISDQLSEPDRTLAMMLKTKKISDVYECLDNLANFYPTNTTLSSEEFNDVFGAMIDDSDELFIQMSNDKDIDSCVDVYECFASIVILCGEDLEVKMKSGIIEEKELVMSLQSTIRGLCKIANLNVPSLSEIEDYSNKIFTKIDSDGSKTIEFEEFEKYVKSSYELQDFLLKYAMTQTYENAERRHRVFMAEAKNIFQELQSSPEEENIPADKIFEKLKEEIEGLDEPLFNDIKNVLKNTSNVEHPDIDPNLINRESYLNVMNAWCAFTATDINNDGTISREELKFLLYAYEREKCDEFRLDHEMKELDADSSGEITRKEFLDYLCTNKANTGKVVFRANLKNLFKRYDTDNTGYLNMTELKNLMKDNLKSHYNAAKQKGGQSLENIEGMITSIVEEIIKGLDLSGSGDTVISWNEFREFMEKAMIEQEKLKSFLNSSL